MKTLNSVFEDNASRWPDRPLFTWFDGQGQRSAEHSFGSLRREADRVAAHLVRRHGLQPGDRAALCYPPGPAFLVAFVACVRVGVIPVPVYPPPPHRAGREIEALRRLVSTAGARVVLTSWAYEGTRQLAGLKNRLFGERPAWPEVPFVITDRVGLRDAPVPPRLDVTDEVAFLQFTSGSTTEPRGVRITHQNLEHQIDYNRRALGLTPESRSVLWVPPYHDLGLVSGICSALSGNGWLGLLSPIDFLRKPALWFDLLSSRRATHSAAPNFAFAFLLKHTTAAQRAAWDLSELRVLMSAAEPIDARLMDAFFDAMAPARLSRAAFCPAYGLAEHTVGVTIGGKARLEVDREQLERRSRIVPARGGRLLVGCGTPPADIRVRVVDPERRREVPMGSVGEIWVQSPSVADGYDGDPKSSEAAFGAELADEPGAGRWLRTGDLGALADGELYITGRLKDLIILGGRNIHPNAVEVVVASAHAGIRPGAIAAFGKADPASGSEALVVAVERVDARQDPSAISRAVREHLLRELGLPVAEVVVCDRGRVPRTTSGKVRRRQCRIDHESGALAPVLARRFDVAGDGEEALRGGAIARLAELDAELGKVPLDERLDRMTSAVQAVVAEALGLSDPTGLEPDRPLAELGLDSLALVALGERLALELGRELDTEPMATNPTTRGLAQWLMVDSRPAADSRGEAARAERPERRVAIVGAGGAGLSAAWELSQRGFEHITVFEEAESIGGKVRTLQLAGGPAELGQVGVFAGYHRVRALAREARVELEPMIGPFLEARGATLTGSDFAAEQGAWRAWLEAVMAGFRADGEGGLDEPVGKWLARHGAPPPPPTALFLWTGCGYGPFNSDVPAIYLRRHLELVPDGNVVVQRVVGGNQRLWTRLVEQLDGRLEVRTSAAVRGVRPDPAGPMVRLADGREERFDEVILTTSPHHAARLVEDEALRELLSRYRLIDYRSAIIEAPGLREIALARLAATQPGRSMDRTRALANTLHLANEDAMRSADAGDPLALLWVPGTADTYTLFQYGAHPPIGDGAAESPALDDEALDQRIMGWTRRLGVSSRVVHAVRWSYFPYLESADRARTEAALDERQGQGGVWVTGAWRHMETLEHAVRSGEEIVAQGLATAGAARAGKSAAPSAREALDALVTAHRGPAIACTPASNRDLLLGAYHRRAGLVSKLGWRVPVLHPRARSVANAEIGAWAAFYLPEGSAEERAAVSAVAARIAGLSPADEIEIDPWDVFAWLEDEPDLARRASARAGLGVNGYLPASADLSVITIVHERDTEVSLRLTASHTGFGDRCRHFLLRYLVATEDGPALARVFDARGAGLWIEGTRGVFNAETGHTVAGSLEAFRDLVGVARDLVTRSDGALAMFCEMPVWFGALTGMERWGDVSLLHGAHLYQVT